MKLKILRIFRHMYVFLGKSLGFGIVDSIYQALILFMYVDYFNLKISYYTSDMNIR